MHVDVVALVSGSSRPELPPAHVTIGPASRVAASRNLESTAPGMSSSNSLETGLGFLTFFLKKIKTSLKCLKCPKTCNKHIKIF